MKILILVILGVCLAVVGASLVFKDSLDKENDKINKDK